MINALDTAGTWLPFVMLGLITAAVAIECAKA